MVEGKTENEWLRLANNLVSSTDLNGCYRQLAEVIFASESVVSVDIITHEHAQYILKASCDAQRSLTIDQPVPETPILTEGWLKAQFQHVHPLFVPVKQDAYNGCLMPLVVDNNIEAVAFLKGNFDTAFLLETRQRSQVRRLIELALRHMVVLKKHHMISSQLQKTLRNQQMRLEYLAHFDQLTGLPNRYSLTDKLRSELLRLNNGHKLIALVLMDLDRFKNINDSYGHETGDKILQGLASRFKQSLRPDEFVARFGGDEYVFILHNIDSVMHASKRVDELQSALSEIVEIDRRELRLSASFGMSLFPDFASTDESLIQQADIALNHAKASGRKHLKVYEPSMAEQSIDFLHLESDLRRALENNELELFYQPQVDLFSTRVQGLEALIRWNHPERGFLTPFSFIDFAEESGMINDIGLWVLREACRQQKYWLDRGIHTEYVSVNIAAGQFSDPNFCQQVSDALSEAGLPSQYLELEITESSLMKNGEVTVDILHQLNSMGVSLAIDDFGTGYSSLAYLKRFPIQKLKIDRSFVRDIEACEDDSMITQTIIGLAKNMRMNVVAEGVETEEQRQRLLSFDCQWAQGYLFSKPLPVDQLEAYLLDQKHKQMSAQEMTISSPTVVSDMEPLV